MRGNKFFIVSESNHAHAYHSRTQDRMGQATTHGTLDTRYDGTGHHSRNTGHKIGWDRPPLTEHWTQDMMGQATTHGTLDTR